MVGVHGASGDGWKRVWHAANAATVDVTIMLRWDAHDTKLVLAPRAAKLYWRCGGGED